jgi:glyoxylase-like metal-dependent hydrolase (beta-lactamase superfamily II)
MLYQVINHPFEKVMIMIMVDSIEGGPFDSNIFLVTKGNTRVLIDAGAGFHTGAVVENTTKLLKGGSLDGIILTHEHFDHCGGTKGIAEAFDCPVYASAECARAVRDGNENLTGAFLFGAHMEPLQDVFEVKDQLTIGELEFRIEETPGHSPGSICVITRDEGHLFCGDLIFCDGGVGRWDLPGGNLGLLKDSIMKTLHWDVSSLHPGHGRSEDKDPKREMNLAMSMLSSV